MTSEPTDTTIEQLFERALACEPHERAAFLDRTCRDREMRREIESLLEADEQAGSFLEPRAPMVHILGERIGHYRLTRVISEGDTASVYLAARDDGQYEQQVAIKLISQTIAARHVLMRFLQERQILASLVHPNIARLLDGGTTSAGQPYLVMEYVDGEPLDTYCRRRNLPLTRRLELFITVCQAVHFAHSSLIVHRDLKPSNILVGTDGVPKLLDFGIAKLLDPDRVGVRVERTATHNRVMTPHYASPEQVLGSSIGTGSDIYSLGVVLYELLTGSRPYELESQSLREIERIVCNSIPPLPSRLVRASRRERLPRDLDNIVLMAMRKEPGRRYASAQELAADVRRCIEHRPVLAQRDTLTYRVSSFVRRHAGAVAAAVTIVLLLLGGIIATTWQWRQAVAERARVEIQRSTAEQTLRFLVDLFRIPDARVAIADVSARDLLDHGVRQLREGPPRSPAVRAALLNALSWIYGNLGHERKAVELLTEAYVAWPFGAEARRRWIDSSYDLGSLDAKGGDPRTAPTLLQRARALRMDLLGEEHPLIADGLQELISNAVDKLPVVEAEAQLRRLVSYRLEDPRFDDLQLSSSMVHLAELYSFTGHHEEAETFAREAIAIRSRESHGEQCRAGDGEFQNRLAFLRYRQGYFDEAEHLLEGAYTCLVRALGPDHPDVVDLSALRIMLWREQGRYAEAEALARQSLVARTKLRSETSPAVDNAQHQLAYVLYERGKLAEAEQWGTSALKLRERRLGHVHSLVATSLVLRGQIHLTGGSPAEAETEFREALDIWQRTRSEHPDIAIAWRGLAESLLAQNQIDPARSAAMRGLYLSRRLQPTHPAIAAAFMALGVSNATKT